ncbi:MAG: ribosomal protein L7/L12 [Myxococcales bacterium]|nr:ribosomal protein L7/L12 [Myxococcales bacterium]
MDDAERSLVERIRAEPLEAAPRQVYADWLDTQGDARAALVRADLDFAAGREPDAAWEVLARAVHTTDLQWMRWALHRYEVILEAYDPGLKLNAIKEIRRLTGVGLKEAKEASESLPSTLFGGLDAARGAAVQGLFERLRHPTLLTGDVRLVLSPSMQRADAAIYSGRWCAELSGSGADSWDELWSHPDVAVRGVMDSLPEHARFGLPCGEAIVVRERLCRVVPREVRVSLAPLHPRPASPSESRRRG